MYYAVLKKVVIAMHKCKHPKDNRWFDYVDKLCCYEIVSQVRLKGQRLNPLTAHTDTSDKQLGAVISNNNKPIDFLSRRFSKAQCNYTTSDKEILAIVEFFK